MLPRSIPGVLFHSGGLVGPPWVPKGVHSRVWVIGPHTHRGEGGAGLFWGDKRPQKAAVLGESKSVPERREGSRSQTVRGHDFN